MSNLSRETGLFRAALQKQETKAGRTRMNTLRHFVVALVIVAAIASCSGQSLLASAATTDRSLAIPANLNGSGVSTGGTDLDQRASIPQQAAQPPDAPSAV